MGSVSGGAAVGSSHNIPVPVPSQPQTVVPVKPSQADAQDNEGARQTNIQTQDDSATIPPPSPAAWTGDIMIKDWEWLAMVLSSL